MADDFSELYELAADISSAPATANRFVKKAVQFTATEVKKDWQQGAQRKGLSGYAASVDYDLKYPGGAIEAEIGPNLSKNQGSLGLVEEGGSGVMSAPQHAGRDALEANEADFLRGLEIAIFDATAEAVKE